MGLFSTLRGRLKIRVRLMILTSGIVSFSVLALSFVVIFQYQKILIEKTLDVCRNLSINVVAQAQDELLLNDDVFTSTKEAVRAVKSS
ncbi:MAG TPA: hypothetical protein PKJ30_08190, partial [Leptospiraceae bacterium]|nr:hypothetical protein [Leptospiraceae bacterium]